MSLTTAQKNRAAGVLIGQACGDALGVPYEFGAVPHLGTASMTGGGLGGYAPGEWSDDTQMALCIATVAATGADLTTKEATDEVAARFEAWFASKPGDVGIQTARVLYAAGPASGSSGERLRRASRALHEESGRSAGNGALMRTSVVGLSRLHDRVSTAAAARALAVLTHWDPLAGDACVLWSEAIRVAVLEGRLEVVAGLDLLPGERRSQWADWVQDAVDDPRPERFGENGFTVPALQAAVAALVSSDIAAGRPEAFAQALHLAISAGHDTDTVAAITGGLAGAVLGVSAVPHAWQRQVHGWPGPRDTHARARDLIALALSTAVGGERASTFAGVDHVEPSTQISAAVELAP